MRFVPERVSCHFSVQEMIQLQDRHVFCVSAWGRTYTNKLISAYSLGIAASWTSFCSLYGRWKKPAVKYKVLYKCIRIKLRGRSALLHAFLKLVSFPLSEKSPGTIQRHCNISFNIVTSNYHVTILYLRNWGSERSGKSKITQLINEQRNMSPLTTKYYLSLPRASFCSGHM